MSILSRLASTRAVATVAIALVVAACSSAASAAPSAAPTGAAATQAATTATAAPTSPAAATPSPTPNLTQNDVLSPSPPAPGGTPVLVDPFISAGIATDVDTAATAVDPSKYRTTIPGKDYHAVYVVFALKPDTVGKVSMVMTFNDVEVLQKPLSIDYGTINSWGNFKVNFDPGKDMPLGIYKTVMTFEPTGAQVVQYFAVT
jgi:hypothetical protein